MIFHLQRFNIKSFLYQIVIVFQSKSVFYTDFSLMLDNFLLRTRATSIVSLLSLFCNQIAIILPFSYIYSVIPNSNAVRSKY